MRPPPFLATQWARPSGLFGRFVMGRFLNRTTADHNAMVLEDLAVESTSRVLEVGFGGAALLERLCQKASGGFVAGLDRHGFTAHSPDELKSALVAAGFRHGSLRSGADTRGSFYSLVVEREPTSRTCEADRKGTDDG